MAKAGQTSWTPAIQRRCEAIALNEAASGALVGFKEMCRLRNPSLSFPDPVVLRLEIPHVLPMPDLPRVLGGKQLVAASAIIEIDAVGLSGKPPSAADLLPDDIGALLKQAVNANASGKPAPEFVTFAAKFVSAKLSRRRRP